ncbi:MAG: leucine zipper domain-containing protein [Myxococcota bacterium]
MAMASPRPIGGGCSRRALEACAQDPVPCSGSGSACRQTGYQARPLVSTRQQARVGARAAPTEPPQAMVDSGGTCEAAGVARRTTCRWLARLGAEGRAGLEDRSCRPHRLSRPTSGPARARWARTPLSEARLRPSPPDCFSPASAGSSSGASSPPLVEGFAYLRYANPDKGDATMRAMVPSPRNRHTRDARQIDRECISCQLDTTCSAQITLPARCLCGYTARRRWLTCRSEKSSRLCAARRAGPRTSSPATPRSTAARSAAMRMAA